ncbi:MAG: hypothetical protein UR73_C0026G0004 [candidate division WS6 bacterium GW2011_GWF1_35_23]|uniref:ATP-grasp fold RimK-type domain-containing protein n=1 Tax=candidate division WS6 bacterium GW2011_GWF1_35_23 TaxID=1619097 RepID=A0A0G0CKK4_9BACT|nr:MAG: hypothetical protein UR73_C0026G0004 [candidate division WS6 bacterium GW2011_GWF1_35_23]
MKYLVIDKRPRVKQMEIPTASVRILEELKKKDIPTDFVYNDEIEILFTEGSTQIKAKGIDVKEYTHIIFRGHALHNDRQKRYIIDYIEQHNSDNPEKKVLVQNSKAIKKLPYYNKVAISLLCSQYNLPYFQTYYRTDGKYLEPRDMLKEYPLIIKEYAGINRVEIIDGEEKIKKNVYKIEKDEDFEQEGLKGQNLGDFFLQEFSDTAEDYRVFVKLGKVIGGWKRSASKGFMTVNKGIYEMYNEPDQEMKEIAEKMASILEADFIAVDFMYMNGKPCIQEISLHPGFKAYETKIKGTPVNIAEAIITAF